ncbi:MAG TPA: DNA primase [Terriglobales bacterium]|nr:DNA primase [Terriglobales bacterium]
MQGRKPDANSRIPESFIHDVLSRTDIVSLIDAYVPLKRAGRNYTACCPFHKEKTPSFSVSPDKQFYYCFGCGATGNAISFVMDYQRLDFIGALKQLARVAGMELPKSEEFRGPSYQPLYNALAFANQFFQDQLRNPQNGKRGQQYFKQRKVTGETAKAFALGYAAPGWDNLIQAAKKAGIATEHLLQTGLITEKSPQKQFDMFRDRVMFPIRNLKGQVIGFGGRVLGDEKPKYLNSPETPVFHKRRELYGLYEARQAGKFERLLVVEGYMDVIALAQFGVRYAVATLGTATSTEHIELMFKQVTEIVFCFDGDAAGRRAAWRALESALPALRDGRQASFLFLPEGEDPDSLIRVEGKELFEDRLKRATPLGEYLFEHLKEEIDTRSLEGKARFAKTAQPLIALLPQGVLRQLMTQHLSELTGLDIHTLTQALAGEAPAQTPAETSSARHAEPDHTNFDEADYPAYYDSRPDYPEPEQDQPGYEPYPAEPKKLKGKFFDKKKGNPIQRQPLPQRVSAAPVTSLIDQTIQILLHAPDAAAQLEIPNELNALTKPNAKLLRELLEFAHSEPHCNIISILAHWHGTEEAEQLFALAAKEFLLEAKNQSVSLKDALLNVRRLYVDEALQKLLQSNPPDKEKLRELLNLQNALKKH